MILKMYENVLILHRKGSYARVSFLSGVWNLILISKLQEENENLKNRKIVFLGKFKS